MMKPSQLAPVVVEAARPPRVFGKQPGFGAGATWTRSLRV